MSVTGTWEEESAVWEVIQKDTPLHKGDIVRLNYQISGIMWLNLYQLDQIDKNLEGNPDFEVLNHSIPDEKNQMFWTVRVRHDSVVIVALIVAAILGACLTILLGPTLYFRGATRYIQAKTVAAEKGVTLEEATVGEQALQIGLAAVAVIVAWAWLKGKK
jgi:hypothetical protein